MRGFISKSAACLLLVAGCGSDAAKDATGSGTSDMLDTADASTCAADPAALTVSDDVDILVVVDDSASMMEEQQQLAAQLPKLVKAVSAGKLKAFDGSSTDLEFPRARSVHVGVVSTNMGINGVTGIAGCEGNGKDGVLQTQPMLSAERCRAPLSTLRGSYLSFDASADDPQRFTDDFACLAQLGTAGCGFEQQLEAMWKALAPTSDTTFSGGSHGHGEAKNKGFLRAGSLLVVLVITDEEDCSIPDASREIFAPNSADPKFTKPDGNAEGVNSRCALHATDGTLHPVARYIDGLKGLRRNDDGRIVFAAFTGVPPEAESMRLGDGTQDFAAILGMPEMQIRFDKADPELLNSSSGTLPDPACESALGRASPARRIVKTAAGFGKNGIVRSICSADFSASMRDVTTSIATMLQTSADERAERCGP